MWREKMPSQVLQDNPEETLFVQLTLPVAAWPWEEGWTPVICWTKCTGCGYTAGLAEALLPSYSPGSLGCTKQRETEDQHSTAGLVLVSEGCSQVETQHDGCRLPSESPGEVTACALPTDSCRTCLSLILKLQLFLRRDPILRFHIRDLVVNFWHPYHSIQ